MEFLLGFVLGAIAGVSALIAYSYYQMSKIRKLKSKVLDEVRKKIDDLDAKRKSIADRLIKAQEITQQQLDLRSQAEMPSMNAVHSQYKNGLVAEIHKLEEEKLAVLRSILEDGYDPMIKVTDEKGQHELPLSHFVNPPSATPPPPPSDGMKRVGKFVILKGGKDDGTVH